MTDAATTFATEDDVVNFIYEIQTYRDALRKGKVLWDMLSRAQRPLVSIKPMELSGNRTDYFVSIRVGDREVTPHVFREEYKAAYHVALYDWLLNESGEEPDVVEFGPNDWPARPSLSAGKRE